MNFNNNDNETHSEKGRPSDQDGCASDSSQSYSLDHHQRAIEYPLYSQGWSLFFYSVVFMIMAYALLSSLLIPGLIEKRTEEICRKESLVQNSQSLTQSGACISFYNFRDNYPLYKRLETFNKAFPISMPLLYIARRLKSQKAQEAICFDKRLPVLYFRSFSLDRDDERKAQSLRIPYTEESEMVSNLKLIGPVLAIGRPGERLAPLGAARLYVGNDDWQTIVQRLMNYAQIVIIRVGGDSPSIRWELETARKKLEPEKLALWFPTKFSTSTYTEVQNAIREGLQVEMPRICPAGFITFNSDWHPNQAKSVIYFIDDLLATPKTFTKRAYPENHLLAMQKIIEEVPSLVKLLEQLDVTMIAQPPFQMHSVVWAAGAFWSVLLLGLPGSRWSFGFVEVLDLPQYLGSIFEGLFIILAALSLAFFSYMREPRKRMWPSLTFLSILVCHSFWIVARAGTR